MAFNLRAASTVKTAPATEALKTEVFFAQSFKNAKGETINEPVMTLKRGFTQISFGLNKALLLHEAAGVIAQFVEQNKDKLAKAEATYHQRMQDGTYSKLAAEGKIKDRVVSGDKL